MKIGTKVKVRYGHVYNGSAGKISKIYKGWNTNKLIAKVIFEIPVGHYQAKSLDYYLYQLEVISKPIIKLKKFSAWK